MTENIKVGDVVVGHCEGDILPDCGCVVLVRSPHVALILYQSKSTTNLLSSRPLTKDEIDSFQRNKRIVIDNIEQYIGQHTWWVNLENLTVKDTKDNPRSYPRICAKCGQFDEYACPSPKHNGEVRCYLHCE